MKNAIDKLKDLQEKLNQEKLFNTTLKNSSPAIPDPDLQTKLIDSHKKMELLEVKIGKLKDSKK